MPGASSRPSESRSDADQQLVDLLERQTHQYDFTDWLPHESGHINMLQGGGGTVPSPGFEAAPHLSRCHKFIHPSLRC